MSRGLTLIQLFGLEDVLPHLFISLRDRLHERGDEVLRRLHAQYGQNSALGLHPFGFLHSLRI